MAEAAKDIGAGWESFWAGAGGAPMQVLGPPAPPRVAMPGLAQSRARDLLFLRDAEAALAKVRGISAALRAQQHHWHATGRISMEEGGVLEGQEAARYARLLAGQLASREAWASDAERELHQARASFAAKWGMALPV